MEFPRSVFKSPGDNICQGGSFKTLLVQNELEYDDAMNEEWYASVPEALASKGVVLMGADAPNPAPTRAEMEIKARELGLQFHPQISDKKLLVRITAALESK